ncbi:MAG: DUF2177 family protein [Patescibacteria group bacterium]
MKDILKLFSLALPIMVALDLSWVSVIAASFYHANLGPLLAPVPHYGAIVLFYIFYTLVLIYFALRPALIERSLPRAMINAAVLGFGAYMTIDLTNYALIAGWPLTLAVVDIAWGIILTSLTAGLTYLVATKIFTL